MNVDDDAKSFLEKYIVAIFKEHEDFEDIFRNILCGQGVEPNLETILSYIIGNVIGFLDGFYLSKHNRTMNVNERKIYLYDTYEGMSKPTIKDIRSYDNYKAQNKWHQLKKSNLKWDYASLEEVKKNLYSTKYPIENLKFIKGKVEDTIPKTIPEKISILRLDTDWYESTYHELVYLFPRLVKYGILILDDYGHWKGAKAATEKYFNENNIKIFLNRIDNTGRIAIKI